MVPLIPLISCPNIRTYNVPEMLHVCVVVLHKLIAITVDSSNMN